MRQTRLSSFIEQLVNVGIGFCIALTAQLLIYPSIGITISVETHVEITLMFTGISIIRGYIIRRWFNARIHKFADNMDRRFHDEGN